jgi:hypothetical protein
MTLPACPPSNARRASVFVIPELAWLADGDGISVEQHLVLPNAG